eukprot:1189771-Prorocentrum_minimum.AAC.1
MDEQQREVDLLKQHLTQGVGEDGRPLSGISLGGRPLSGASLGGRPLSGNLGGGGGGIYNDMYIDEGVGEDPGGGSRPNSANLFSAEQIRAAAGMRPAGSYLGDGGGGRPVSAQEARYTRPPSAPQSHFGGGRRPPSATGPIATRHPGAFPKSARPHTASPMRGVSPVVRQQHR